MNVENRKDKKELKYIKIVDGVQLMQELYEALPELKLKEEKGDMIINLRLFTKGHEITLLVPADANEKVIDEVVYLHEFEEHQKDGES